MERRLHFISGLPRAGSTLAAAILRQSGGLRAFGANPPYGTKDSKARRVVTHGVAET